MSQKVVLEVEVRDGDVNELNQELNKTSKHFKEVETNSKKASVGVDEVTKNGGAIATLDKLTGGLATRFKELYEASGLFNGSLKAMRVALVATGIGAFVVAVGLVVAYWSEIKDLIFQTTKNLEASLEATKSITGHLEAELAILERQMELNTLQGKANEELEKQRVKVLERLQEQNDYEVSLLEKQLTMLKLKHEEVGYWDSIVGAIKFQLFGVEGLASHSAGLAAQRLKEINDLETAIDQAKLKAVDLSIQMFTLQNPETAPDPAKPREKRAKVEAVSSGKMEPQEIKKLSSFEQYLNEMQPLLARQTEMFDTSAQYEMYLADEVTNAKVDIAKRGIQLLMMASEQGSKTYKAFAIAQATISTYEGANAAFKSASASPITTFFPAYPFLQAGLAVGAGILQVKNIMKTNPKGSSGTPTRAGAGGGGAIPQPTFNVAGNSGVNQLSDAISGQLDKPVKAYITHGDVKTAGQLDKDAVRSASI